MYPQTIPYATYKDRLRGKIKNLDQLPGGLRCNYLVLVAGQGDELVAKEWKRKRPELAAGEYLIIFK